MMHKRVLAVDDDAMNLLILREILEEECDLQTVDNGQAALEAARTFRPDLILLDIMMPGMSGLEVCRAVRAEPSLRFIKIILVSAKASLTERLEGYDAGADDYVIKPFDGSELLAKVRVFCSLRFMEETDQIKSDFLTVLAHETRTPLTRIVGAVAVLGDLAKSGDTQQFLQIIDQASGQIQYLLDRILLILSFRMSASAGVLPPQPISQLCRPAWANGRSEIATSWGAGTEAAVVQADPRHLAIAFEALHRFARAWHENQGEVSLRTEIEGKEWVMTLEGIATAAALDRPAIAFEPLEVADVDHHGGAIELELPLVHSVCTAYGGALELRHRAEGRACLRMRLPLASADGLRTAA